VNITQKRYAKKGASSVYNSLVNTLAAIALGSNLGDREPLLRAALGAIAALPGTTILRASSFHETAPVGGPPGQGAYLNAAAAIETALAPRELLDALLAIEAHLGRTRTPGGRNEARTIDLDILLFGDAVIDEPATPTTTALTVPHPRMHLRAFVLHPLAEILPDAVHPVVGRTIAELRAALDAQDAMPTPMPAGGPPW
jgi:2-amino-4-hydroxy-6-hydroxymethyldihydropteridine diphosphokinase